MISNAKDKLFPPTDRRMRSKTAILFGMGIYLTVLIVTGNLANYINPRFAWLVSVGAVIFFLLGWVNLYGMRHPQENESSTDIEQPNPIDTITWGTLAIVAIPLLLAVLIPSRPLGVEAVNGGISLNPVGVSRATAFIRDPLERNLLDWLREFSRSDTPAIFNGQPVDVIGFVYHEPTFLDDKLVVSRFMMRCCVADAVAIGLPVIYENANDFVNGAWVRVQGRLKADDFGENFMPIIYATAVEIVAPPAQPYFYP